jgi:hypothetical protein
VSTRSNATSLACPPRLARSAWKFAAAIVLKDDRLVVDHRLVPEAANRLSDLCEAIRDVGPASAPDFDAFALPKGDQPARVRTDGRSRAGGSAANPAGARASLRLSRRASWQPDNAMRSMGLGYGVERGLRDGDADHWSVSPLAVLSRLGSGASERLADRNSSLARKSNPAGDPTHIRSLRTPTSGPSAVRYALAGDFRLL